MAYRRHTPGETLMTAATRTPGPLPYRYAPRPMREPDLLAMTTPTLPRITGTSADQGRLPVLHGPDALWRLLPTLHPNAPVMRRLGRYGWSTVTLNQGLGMSVLHALRGAGVPVGPVLHCGGHRVVNMPVSAWPEGLPTHGILTVRRGTTWCPDASRECPGQLWLLSPDGEGPYLTEAEQLFDAVHSLRSTHRRAHAAC